MYQVCANINDVKVTEIPLLDDFQLNIEAINKSKAKLVFICSPNNPSGNALMDIEKILNGFAGLVVLDEAYTDFDKGGSYLQQLEKYDKLIILQTLSKAWGLAAARIGFAYANTTIINLLNKVKAPYNISSLNQQAAIEALQNVDAFKLTVNNLISERQKLAQKLSSFPFVVQVYNSDANFLLIKVNDANALYDYLLTKKIIIRNRNQILKNCVRISVGTANENQQLINALDEYSK